MAMKQTHSEVHEDMRQMPKGKSSKEEPRMSGMNVANHHNGTSPNCGKSHGKAEK